MYKLICVTSRKIFYDTFGKEADFAGRVREILDAGVKVILREKDMSEREYADLLRKIGRREITAHTFASAAAEYGCREIHLPLPVLEKCDINAFDIVGVQCIQKKKPYALRIWEHHILQPDMFLRRTVKKGCLRVEQNL